MLFAFKGPFCLRIYGYLSGSCLLGLRVKILREMPRGVLFPLLNKKNKEFRMLSASFAKLLGEELKCSSLSFECVCRPFT